MKFAKMHALGNDYIVVNTIEETAAPVEDAGAFAKAVCDRRFGIGADGILFVREPSEAGKEKNADFRMEIYNADGSRAQMCGNGIRCFAKYVYDSALISRKKMMIETDAGLREANLQMEGGQVVSVSVDMGEPVLEARRIPVLSEKALVVNEPIQIKGREYFMTCVSMGNPHAVLWVNDPERFPVEVIGSAMEFHERFPERVNTEFAKVVNHKTIEMRVWERGVGETLACGTGACAVCAAGVLGGLTDEEVTVKLRRGNLYVRWNRSTNRMVLTGKAVHVFDGII